MDSLFSILSDKNFDEPAEIGAIKAYVKKKFQTEVGVKVTDRDIVVLVPSAALASRLRYDVQALKRVSGGSKPIRFRISG
jgi:hypothetical protein